MSGYAVMKKPPIGGHSQISVAPATRDEMLGLCRSDERNEHTLRQIARVRLTQTRSFLSEPAARYCRAHCS
jgi:hypothetical protein